jgi:membrane associated rhomboid family serine protease
MPKLPSGSLATIRRLTVPQTARQMLNQRSAGLLNMMPKRSFSSKFETFLESFLERIPGRNFGYVVAGLNTICYAAYCFWPQWKMHKYLNNFSFSLFGLNQGYIHNILTCHFSHQSLFQYVIDSAIVVLMSQNLVYSHGPVACAKVILLSMFMGSLFLLAYHTS